MLGGQKTDIRQKTFFLTVPWILDAIPDGTLSSRRVVPQPSSPIYLNVTIWVQHRRFELKPSPNRSVLVQITISTNFYYQKSVENNRNQKKTNLNCPIFLFLCLFKYYIYIYIWPRAIMHRLKNNERGGISPSGSQFVFGTRAGRRPATGRQAQWAPWAHGAHGPRRPLGAHGSHGPHGPHGPNGSRAPRLHEPHGSHGAPWNN